ncbi:MAG: hypothetical protein ACJ79Y_20830, partial [Myxococcales bacterium]
CYRFCRSRQFRRSTQKPIGPCGAVEETIPRRGSDEIVGNAWIRDIFVDPASRFRGPACIAAAALALPLQFSNTPSGEARALPTRKPDPGETK